MINTAQRKPRFIAWLLTAVLLLVGAGAVAHELDHALDHHHELCALHHYAGHHGGLPASSAHPPAPPIEARLNLPSAHHFFSKSRPAPYAVRAPPQV
ncbi:MAG: hypothetical protein A3E57_09070 [Candidatus Muproteobacteria bacterium RIFCSPHIGHO2_12_FULL_60_33]|uniref:Uncharacterized protein n=1 Tax=Candidatus Muproteobacteria bacterium RIFCSPLOWO2_01_FULL_60_18 TaxID=1817768 RepID=A0A1F6U3I8_9PROT|nr:MAG: hypothetical protein A3A87_08860 [Candidatus Muproteobacteria bacterium RIFCSPLOWO2_01_FULL_60_18]OGI52251.1 MAG: hypothetical protein A2W42_02115 [Candidatus Muproteobacteria bacterium RIFCSPHIGHO2_01_60_12]OGI54143.1 MAG: hypothetical protein A3E57_09070 [Candidatus Muproteobacteria bacterium RIFCSPHIGHO2_12_FULL_60_33]OGI55233.1 MAG: hypothetical protein A3D32_00995 [Candidatus Muproteobacteria bacterium RIFCSPHIGHO2_02_FULL_60_13]